ncbi:MAG: NAD(P)/FAD-dependent oxidoreductase [Acidobacteriota bacterium]
MTRQEPTRIVILGGGFAGLYAALELERTLAGDPAVEVTLVNQDNFFLFTPMLHEIAASDLDVTHIVNPIRKLLDRVRFFHGRIESIDLERRRVGVFHGDSRHHHELSYDHLVLGCGAVTNFFGIPGLEERALTMKSLADAVALRNRLIAQLEEADFECSIGRRDHLLSVVVAGGGFSGVETVGAVNDFVREALAFYPHLAQERVRVVLVHPGPVVLPELGEKLGLYAQEKLRRRQVEVRVNTKVVGVSDGGVLLDDGTEIPAGTLVWTAGTSPHPLLAALPCRTERGRVVVDEFLAVPGWPGVWAAGDAAVVPDPSTGRPHPPTAQHALREGRVLAQNLAAATRGKALRPFAFSTLGQLATIGRRTGVARILGLNFSGFLAWWLWRTIYLSKLPRFEKKVRVVLDWTLDLLFSKDLVEIHTSRAAHARPPEEARGPLPLSEGAALEARSA